MGIHNPELPADSFSGGSKMGEQAVDVAITHRIAEKADRVCIYDGRGPGGYPTRKVDAIMGTDKGVSV